MVAFALSAPARTIFGQDSRLSAAQEIARLGKRVLLVRGRSVAWVDDLAGQLLGSGRAVEAVYSSGEPDLDAVRNAVLVARDHGADCIVGVGVGGGAVIDLGKAVAGLSAR